MDQKKCAIVLTLCITIISCGSRMEKTMDLYVGEIPNSKNVKDNEKVTVKDGVTIVSGITRPTLTIHLPPERKANGAAVLICPGGGYFVNAIEHEGNDVARKFTDQGMAAFVLKYRIPDDSTMVDKTIGPLQDAQRALSVIRERAQEWNVDVNKVGVLGFSAGGHLASTVGTHFHKPVINTSMTVRPNFLILIYPVISFQDAFAHTGSRKQLLGESPSQDLIDLFSNEKQVSVDTPPSFIVHCSDDEAVSARHSTSFYTSLLVNKIPAELHIYQRGGHGFGLHNRHTKEEWFDRCMDWLNSNGYGKD